MGHNSLTLAYQRFKRGDIITASYGNIMLVENAPLDCIEMRKHVGKVLVLEPLRITTSGCLASAFSVTDGNRGVHLVGQYCLASSDEKAVNAEKVAFGPFARKESDNFRFVSKYVSSNNGSYISDRADYDCGFIMKATKKNRGGSGYRLPRPPGSPTVWNDHRPVQLQGRGFRDQGT
jgi:hypothetical protein